MPNQQSVPLPFTFSELLSDDDRQQLSAIFERVSAARRARGIQAIVEQSHKDTATLEPLRPVTINLPPDAIVFAGESVVINYPKSLVDLMEKCVKTGGAAEREQLLPKKRNSERDAAIAEMKDNQKMKWARILEKLRKHPEWKTMENDQPINEDAIKKAYKRWKNR